MINYPEDKIVENVLNKIKDRADDGLAKYGVPMTRSDVTTKEWLQHAQEELMDAAIYIERIMKDFGIEPPPQDIGCECASCKRRV